MLLYKLLQARSCCQISEAWMAGQMDGWVGGWVGENKALMHFPKAFSNPAIPCMHYRLPFSGFHFSAWHHHRAAAHRTSLGERVPQSAALCPEVPSTALCAGAVAVARGCEDLRGRPSRRVRNSSYRSVSAQLLSIQQHVVYSV